MAAAALPMYDWPELREATDALWARWRDAMRARGLAAPDGLARDRSAAEIWDDPDLLVAQTCGAPYVSRRPRLRLVATPIYDAPGCVGPAYRSWIVVRRDARTQDFSDLIRGRVAVNDFGSMSGWWAFGAAGLAPDRAGALVTGAHRASIRAVAEGAADFAAIDAICWAYAQTFEPAAAALRTLASTPLVPGLPFVTAAARADAEIDALRAALDETLSDPALAERRAALRLIGARPLDDASYDAVARLAPPEPPLQPAGNRA